MSFRIQNNISALSSLNALNKNDAAMGKSLEKLSSGYRINSASDDAAGLASSMRFRGEISSLKVASRNTSEAVSMLQVAEGAMSQVDLILNRMKELATQAASGNAASDLSKIDAEATHLESEIDRIVGFTEYNGVSLIDGSFGSVSLSSTGATELVAANGVEKIDVSNAKGATNYAVSAISVAGQTMTMTDGAISQQVSLAGVAALGENEDATLNFSELGVKLEVNDQFWTQVNGGTVTTAAEFDTTALGQAQFQIGSKNEGDSRLGFNLSSIALSNLRDGTNSADIDLGSQSTAQTALTVIDDAIGYLASQRSTVGTLINRLGYTSSNLSVAIENKTASESVIRDVDMAAEMSEFTKNQILVQASTSMLAQANTSSQAVMGLLR